MTTSQTKTKSLSTPDTDSSARSRGLALAVLMAGTFMFALDFFIVNVAIPSTQRDLGASAGEIQLIVVSYAIALAAGLIIGGRLGDLVGRRRVFMVGLALFTAASAICGLAPSATVLIAGRAIQGIGAALFAPQVLSIIGVTYEGEERQKAITLYGLMLGLGAVSGQLIGGLLIQIDPMGLDWRSCYLVNVPIGAAALVLAPRVIAESRAERGDRLDVGGTLLIAAALVAIVLPLVEGRQQGWPTWTWVLLGASVPLLGAFALLQRRLAARGGSPLVHPDLFRERAFTVGLASSIVFYAGMASFFLVLALYLQDGLGLDALDSGLVFTPLAVGYLAASIASQKLAPRLGRQVLALGGVVRGVALVALALTVGAIGTGGDPVLLVPALALDGVGMGLLTAPLISTVLADLDPRWAGAASGVLSTANQVGNTIGVALIGVLFYGALGPNADFAGAFGIALVAIAAISVGVAGLVQFLPGASESATQEAKPAARLALDAEAA
jgi:EmrB/QacA subfamily drug resistance transporter